MAELEYGQRLKRLGGRKFAGMLLMMGVLAGLIALTYLVLPDSVEAWTTLRAWMTATTMIVAAYMGADVTQKYVSRKAAKGKPGEQARQGTPV